MARDIEVWVHAKSNEYIYHSFEFVVYDRTDVEHLHIQLPLSRRPVRR